MRAGIITSLQFEIDIVIFVQTTKGAIRATTQVAWPDLVEWLADNPWFISVANKLGQYFCDLFSRYMYI